MKLKKPIVVGHSMGGMIAAEMAAIAHTEVTKLCLMAPAGLWLDDHPVVDIFSKLPYELPGLLFHDAEAGGKLLTAGRQHGGSRIPEAVPGHECPAAGHGGQDPFPHPRPRPGQRLHRITAKTLIVWGKEDALIPPVYGDAFKKAISKSKLVKVAKAGHAVGQEKPAAVLKAISDFF